MESIGIFFIYIICPLVGLGLLIAGYIDYRKSKTKKKLIIGLALVLVPTLQFLLVDILYQNNYEMMVIGTYKIQGGKDVILTVNPDKTFEINKCNKIGKFGKGTWTIVQSDWLLLVLKLNDQTNDNLYFKVLNYDNVVLAYDSYEKTHLKLIKTIMPSH